MGQDLVINGRQRTAPKFGDFLTVLTRVGLAGRLALFLPMILPTACGHRESAEERQRDANSVAGKTGKVAYSVAKESGKVAKEAEKKIAEAAHQAHEGWKEAAAEDHKH